MKGPVKESAGIARTAAELGVPCRTDAEGKDLSTYRGGGRIARLYTPRNAEELAALYAAGRRAEEDVFLLGGGSNTLVDDGCVRRPVILTRGVREIMVHEDGTVCAECGATLREVARAAAVAGLGGLEFLAGVPATVGGALAMNAGAFGAQIADYVAKICVLNPLSGKTEWIDRDSVPFGYRKGVRGAVIAARFVLPKTSARESAVKREFFLAERRKKQPQAPSLGSVFTGEAGAAGKYIDGAGLKGLCAGGARISPVHGNFIVNLGGGSAADFRFLARLAKETVREFYGVSLASEVVLLSDDGGGVAEAPANG